MKPRLRGLLYNREACLRRLRRPRGQPTAACSLEAAEAAFAAAHRAALSRGFSRRSVVTPASPLRPFLIRLLLTKRARRYTLLIRGCAAAVRRRILGTPLATLA